MHLQRDHIERSRHIIPHVELEGTLERLAGSQQLCLSHDLTQMTVRARRRLFSSVVNV